MRLTSIPVCCCLAVAMTQPCRAAFTLLGPTPYLSAADSPFAEQLGDADFYLEDFEDGELNAPGIFLPLPEVSQGFVVEPSALTNSVDADDGSIDGLGRAGHSLASTVTHQALTDPPISYTMLNLEFTSSPDGRRPTQFGFVWTDGAANSRLRIELVDENYQTIFSQLLTGLGDSNFQGSTADDRFIGVMSPVPFAIAIITSIYGGDAQRLEIDHVQYNLVAIPEPSGIAIGMLLIGGLVTKRYDRTGNALS